MTDSSNYYSPCVLLKQKSKSYIEIKGFYECVAKTYEMRNNHWKLCKVGYVEYYSVDKI